MKYKTMGQVFADSKGTRFPEHTIYGDALLKSSLLLRLHYSFEIFVLFDEIALLVGESQYLDIVAHSAQAVRYYTSKQCWIVQSK